jgi:putative membrane protein
VVIIDLHNHERNKEPKDQLMYGTVEAEHFRNCLKDFLGELEKCELHEYRAGFATEVAGTPKFALLEEVAGQRILVFGTEGNGISHEMMDVACKYEKDFDDIIMFTTDTHSSIHSMIADRHVDPKSLENIIESARENVSKASAGFTSKKAEPMKLLKDDYLGLAYSINILARLIPLTLFLLYIALILWIL